MIFISYRRSYWPFAHRLHEQLQIRLGCEVYIDRKIASDDYETELLGKVRSCATFILIVTPNTFRADCIADDEDWIRREVSLALDLGKPIVLVLYEGLRPPPPESLPEDIRLVTRRQGIEFYPAFFEQAVEKLVSHCAGLLPPDMIRQIATPPVRPRATRERRLEAAMPAEIAQGAATEVRVKVSLTSSKGLRGELPARLKSGDEIKKSDTKQTTFPVTFPVDETGRLLPATLCLGVSSQHFDVGFTTYPESPCGKLAAEIELLPDFDSRTVIFTLIPRGDSPYLGTSKVMVSVFYRGQLIAELRLATTIAPRVAELQYVLDASPLLVGTRPGDLGAAVIQVQGAPAQQVQAHPTFQQGYGRPGQLGYAPTPAQVGHGPRHMPPPAPREPPAQAAATATPDTNMAQPGRAASQPAQPSSPRPRPAPSASSPGARRGRRARWGIVAAAVTVTAVAVIVGLPNMIRNHETASNRPVGDALPATHFPGEPPDRETTYAAPPGAEAAVPPAAEPPAAGPHTRYWTPDQTAGPAAEPPAAEPPAAAPHTAAPPVAAPPPPPPSELVLRVDNTGTTIVSITKNAGKPLVGCVLRSVAVAGNATLIHYDHSENFTITGSEETRIPPPSQLPATGSTFHATVTCENGLSTSQDVIY